MWDKANHAIDEHQALSRKNPSRSEVRRCRISENGDSHVPSGDEGGRAGQIFCVHIDNLSSEVAMAILEMPPEFSAAYPNRVTIY
jgi:hypothetical protein